MTTPDHELKREILCLVKNNPRVSVADLVGSISAKKTLETERFTLFGSGISYDFIDDHDRYQTKLINVIQRLQTLGCLQCHTDNGNMPYDSSTTILVADNERNGIFQRLEITLKGEMALQGHNPKNDEVSQEAKSQSENPIRRRPTKLSDENITEYYRLKSEENLRIDQAKLRRKLLECHEKCVVTDCEVKQCLEAAHIHPHAEGGSCEVRNGLLLRSDVHALFDKRLLWFEQNDAGWLIKISPAIMKTEYSQFNNKLVLDNALEAKDSEALNERAKKAKDSETQQVSGVYGEQLLTLSLM